MVGNSGTDMNETPRRAAVKSQKRYSIKERCPK
jgi:hypothetical protein